MSTALRGEKNDHITHVNLQTVEHIARMSRLLSVPFGVQKAVEQLLLHTVLSLDAEDILYPNAGNIQRKITKDKHSHDAYSPIKVALDGMRSYVDGILDGPHRCQRDAHRQ